jgi:hypothetical protein
MATQKGTARYRLTSTEIARTLTHRRWFVGREPTWENAKTHKDAVDLANKWVKRLLRNSSNYPVSQAAIRLATLMSRCGPRARCGLGSCPRCSRAFQRWCVTQIPAWLDDASGLHTVGISVVVPGASARKGDLQDFDFPKFMDDVRETLITTGLVTKAVLGLDVSFNDFSQRKLHSRWQMHVYGFCQTESREKLRDALKVAYPATATVSRPVRTRRFDWSAKAISYGFKFQHVRRVSYRDDTERWNTKTRRLQAHEHIELMMALSGLGLAGRLVVIGINLPDVGRPRM